jgi:hypothetical protein
LKHLALVLMPDPTHLVMIAHRLSWTICAYALSRYSIEPIAHIAAFVAHVAGVTSAFLLLGQWEKSMCRNIANRLTGKASA